MTTYQVTLEMIVHCPVRICVEASSKEEALELAAAALPMNAYEAHATQNGGWKATVNVKPPKDVVVSQHALRATHISQTSGGEKVRRIA